MSDGLVWMLAVLDRLPAMARDKRLREGLSLREAARRIGVSFSTVDRLEAGRDVELSTAVLTLKWLDGQNEQGVVPPVPPSADLDPWLDPDLIQCTCQERSGFRCRDCRKKARAQK